MREQSENQASTPALMPTEKQKEDITMADMSYLKDMPIAILGAGAVGKTMAADCALEGKEISGVTIRPLSELESFCAAHKPVVAVLCVPRQSAMDLSDELVRLGIQGFWNFSHYDLSVVYPQVTVENVHLGDSLMSLGYRLRSHDE